MSQHYPRWGEVSRRGLYGNGGMLATVTFGALPNFNGLVRVDVGRASGIPRRLPFAYPDLSITCGHCCIHRLAARWRKQPLTDLHVGLLRSRRLGLCRHVTRPVAALASAAGTAAAGTTGTTRPAARATARTGTASIASGTGTSATATASRRAAWLAAGCATAIRAFAARRAVCGRAARRRAAGGAVRLGICLRAGR